MKLSRERIGIIAKDIVKGLTEGAFLALDIPESDLARKITAIITEELMTEDRLEAEAWKILKSHQSEIQKGDADLNKVFLMIKKKLAEERGIIL